MARGHPRPKRSGETPMNDTMTVFDRRAVRRHRDRAAAGLDGHGFLFDEIGERLVDRLDDINRRFTRVLDLGGRTGGHKGGGLARRLSAREGVETVVTADLSEAMTRAAPRPAIVADEEMLPFAEGAFDLIVSNCSLHWVNDLPGALIQIRRALRPDGLFLAAMAGGETLHELRGALMGAESAVEGGASPRVSPVADLRDAGALLQRAGFALPVADTDTITVTYPDALALMRDLRGMGETNAVAARRKGFTRRETLLRAAAGYVSEFGDAEGRIPATFQVLYLTGWAPHPDQQKPLRPGSAAGRLADALDAEEVPTGDKAGRT